MSANDNTTSDRDTAREGDIGLQDLDDENVTQTRGNRGALLESSASALAVLFFPTWGTVASSSTVTSGLAASSV